MKNNSTSTRSKNHTGEIKQIQIIFTVSFSLASYLKGSVAAAPKEPTFILAQFFKHIWFEKRVICFFNFSVLANKNNTRIGLIVCVPFFASLGIAAELGHRIFHGVREKHQLLSISVVSVNIIWQQCFAV